MSWREKNYERRKKFGKRRIKKTSQRRGENACRFRQATFGFELETQLEHH